jgi:hypothetical protein
MKGVPLAPIFSRHPAAYQLVEGLCQVKEEDRITSLAGGKEFVAGQRRG